MSAAADPLGHKTLARRDPVMRDLIKRYGPCTVAPKHDLGPYETLVRAVAFQQLSGKAATTIFNRVLALFPAPFPTPEQILGADPTALRAAGLSANKQAAIRDIAAKAREGVIPKRGEIEHLPDDEIVERLTAARGVGRWTVEMYLIFTLARPDVFPIDDLGVRKGYAAAYGVDMPAPKALLAIGEAWRPYRTLASWLFWRAADGAPRPATPPKTLQQAAKRAAKEKPPLKAARKAKAAKKPAPKKKPAKTKAKAKRGA